jgi:hypothetical protein
MSKDDNRPSMDGPATEEKSEHTGNEQALGQSEHHRGWQRRLLEWGVEARGPLIFSSF